MRGHRYIIQNFINGEGEVFLGHSLIHPSGNDFPQKLHDLSDNSAQRSNPNIKNSWKNDGLFVSGSNSWKRKSKARVTHAEERDTYNAHMLCLRNMWLKWAKKVEDPQVQVKFVAIKKVFQRLYFSRVSC